MHYKSGVTGVSNYLLLETQPLNPVSGSCSSWTSIGMRIPVNVEDKYVWLVTFPELSCQSLTFKIQTKRRLEAFGEKQDIKFLGLAQ